MNLCSSVIMQSVLCLHLLLLGRFLFTGQNAGVRNITGVHYYCLSSYQEKSSFIFISIRDYSLTSE